MKLKQNQLLLITLTMILALSSCKKNETIINPNQSTEKQIIEQFTKVPEGLDPKLNIVVNKLKQLNESTIISWGNRAGLPIWEKAEFKRMNNSISKVSDNDDEVVIIPLSQPNTQEIDGFLACNINVNNTNVNEFDKYTYANYGFNKPSTDVDAEDIVIKCLEFQNSIFGNTKFKILDNRLFNSQNTNSTPNKVFEISLSNEPQSSQTNSKIIITKHNHCIGHDGIGPNGHDGGDCDECDWCGLFSFDIILFDSPLDWGGGGNGGGNGLGGGGNGLSGGGWMPVVLTLSNVWQNIGLTSYQQSFVNNPFNQGIVNNLAALMNNEHFSDEAINATKAVIEAIRYNEINGPFTNQSLFNIMDYLSNTAVEGGAVAYWDYFNYVKNTSYANSSFSEEELYWHITFDCSKTFNYFKNLWWNDPSYKPFYDNYVFTNNGYASGHHWWMNDAWLANFGGANFGNWATNYLKANPAVTFSTFQNHFMQNSEGIDGDYDANYWNNPNLNLPQQNLPSLSSFSAAYPKHSDFRYDTPSKLYNKIGGDVLGLYNSKPQDYQNTCALRISKALNVAGITITDGKDRFKGEDGKYYFVSAIALLKWMQKTFGTPTGNNHLTGIQGGTNGQNFSNLLSGKNGIYIMIPNLPGGCPTPANPQGTGFCASGHADMLINGVCDGGCYFNAKGGVDEIFIWVLQ